MCTLLLSILPGGERLSSSLDSKVRGMIFFFLLPPNNDLSLQSPVCSLHKRGAGQRGGGGEKGKRGLTLLIKSRLVPSVGISLVEEEKKRWRGCEHAVQPGDVDV